MTTALLGHPDMIGSVEHVIDSAEVRRRRLALGWSQEQLAERAGVVSKTVSNAEHGKVGEVGAVRILAALDSAEAERKRQEEPHLETLTVEADGIKLVVTGLPDRLRDLDLNAIIRPRKT